MLFYIGLVKYFLNCDFIPGASQNVSYLAKYSGTDGGIMEFVLNWIEKRVTTNSGIIYKRCTLLTDLVELLVCKKSLSDTEKLVIQETQGKAN